MTSFALLCGHLLGDYILQTDWMASNKSNPHPGLGISRWVPDEGGGHIDAPREWILANEAWHKGHFACALHCLVYTLAVWACSFWWMPGWGLVVIGLVHFPIDRWRLARWWMMNISGQKAFATGPLSPWSIIIVDNIFHLLTLLAVGALA